MRKKITALLMAAIFAIGSAGSAQATIIHKDEWETIYIDSVHLSNDVCTVKRNPKKFIAQDALTVTALTMQLVYLVMYLQMEQHLRQL